MKTTIELPLLPLRDVVVYPHMVIPLFVGREKSIEALESAMAGDKQILLLAQKNPADDDPGEDALYRVGTVATVLQLLKRSEEHTSELQSLMRISYAVFCLKQTHAISALLKNTHISRDLHARHELNDATAEPAGTY